MLKPDSTGSVQLPKTATRRGAVAFDILVARVNLDSSVPGTLAWEGRHFRTGSTISEKELLNYNQADAPIVLEVTELPDTTKLRRRWMMVEILWQWQQQQWIEVARVYPPCSYESLEMRKIAARLLHQDLWRELESVEESAGRIETYLRTEISHCGPRAPTILEIVLRQLVSRLLDFDSRPRFKYSAP